MSQKDETGSYRLRARDMELVDAILKRDHPNATTHQLAEMRRDYIGEALANHRKLLDRLELVERTERAAGWCCPLGLPYRLGHLFELPDDRDELMVVLLKMESDKRETKLIEIERFFGNRGDGDHDK